ncbi:hypothetical protein [Aquisphaera insulae]|uniref:hypothetical protein n=1 Tax=Aquisphaera insulae TaxID=2712864 RepID=UPI0013E9D17D|nr:hypothetical protein [Aquisphaera insulae]
MAKLTESPAPGGLSAPLSIDEATPRALGRACLATTLLLGPILVATWTVPYFLTQDGPAHLYNAGIIARSFSPGSPYASHFEVHWQPLPNWSGHLLLAILLKVVPPWTADRIAMTITLLGFALAIVWLRWVVRGDRGLIGAGLVAAVLAVNLPWLFGFTSFLLGSTFFAITLGAWWAARDRLGPAAIAGVGMLLVVGYFCHLVSLGLTVLSLGFLAVFAPSATGAPLDGPGRLRRLARTMACGLPLLGLLPSYLRLAGRGGPMQPVWENIADPRTVAGWKIRLTWIDPLTLAVKNMIPFHDGTSPLFAVFAPAIWFFGAAVVWLYGGFLASRRGGMKAGPGEVWRFLAVGLLLAGLFSPDTLGPSHGGYLPQRLVLLALAAMVPALDLGTGRDFGRLAAGCLTVGLVVQSAIVWDYALYSQRTAGQVATVRDLVGSNRRIAVLTAGIKDRFRTNPLLHADGWLGLENGNILWNNYEAQHYYFPVQFRPGLDHPDPLDFERVALQTDPRATEDAVALWRSILEKHAAVIDEIVVWGRDPALDAITERWFEVIGARENIRIFGKKRP